jgi:hypothetical protein
LSLPTASTCFDTTGAAAVVVVVLLTVKGVELAVD